MMQHEYIHGSKAVREVWFNDADHTLVVETTSGKRYTFYNQSLEVYKNMLESTSKGKFFNDLIRSQK